MKKTEEVQERDIYEAYEKRYGGGIPKMYDGWRKDELPYSVSTQYARQYQDAFKYDEMEAELGHEDRW